MSTAALSRPTADDQSPHCAPILAFRPRWDARPTPPGSNAAGDASGPSLGGLVSGCCHPGGMADTSPVAVATEQLRALTRTLGDNATLEQRAAVGTLAALLEIANRLDGIEKSLDLGISVRTE